MRVGNKLRLHKWTTFVPPVSGSLLAPICTMKGSEPRAPKDLQTDILQPGGCQRKLAVGPRGPEQAPRKEGAMKGPQEEAQSETRPRGGAKGMRACRKKSQQESKRFEA